LFTCWVFFQCWLNWELPSSMCCNTFFHFFNFGWTGSLCVQCIFHSFMICAFVWYSQFWVELGASEFNVLL
jgi:hypothetical protein